MPVTCESVTRCAGPDVGPITVCNDIGDRRVVLIRKPVRRIPMIVYLFLGQFQRAAGHRSQRLPVELEIPLRQLGFIDDRVSPLEIGSGRKRGRQRQKRD